MDVLEGRGFIGNDDDLVLEAPNLGIGLGPGTEKPAEGKAGEGARGPHITDKGKGAQVDGAGVIGRPVFEGGILFQALDFSGRVLAGGPGGQKLGKGEHDLAIIIGQGGSIAADRAIGVGEEIDQPHVKGLPGQGGKVAGDGEDDLDFLVGVDPQVGGHDHPPGSELGLEGLVILQARVVGRQIQLFEPVLDTHIIEIIQAHDPGPGGPQDLDDPGKVGGPAHQRFIRVFGQGWPHPG